jgi:hypothetical protein
VHASQRCTDDVLVRAEVLRRRDTVFGLGRYGKGADMWSLGEQSHRRCLVMSITDWHALRVLCALLRGVPWSLARAGVILYVVLAARPPFAEAALERQMEKVRFNFDGPVWSAISENAKVRRRRSDADLLEYVLPSGICSPFWNMFSRRSCCRQLSCC